MTMLVTLPVEVLHHIAKLITRGSDLSNFRLTCALFAEIGLPLLSTKATVAVVPESIARLNDISLDPFFRHHISTITLLLNVFYPYNNAKDWKESMKFFELYEYDTLLTSATPDEGWDKSLMLYDALLADQNEALAAFEPLQGLEIACRRFSNLQNLEVRDYRAASFPPYQLYRNQAYKSLCRRHGNLGYWFHLPTYNLRVFSPQVACTGVYLLGSLLHATSHSQPRTLQVDGLAIDVFDGEDETATYTQMRKSTRHLHNLKLCLCAKSAAWGFRWGAARQIMSKNRLKTLLSSAPDLEDLELTYRTVFYEPDTYYTNIAHILPSEHTWPRLRRLRLTNAEITTSIFLDFLRSHGKTLEVLELRDCAIGSDLPLGSQGRRCLWSEIFIHLATSHHLSALSLSGRFVIHHPMAQSEAEVLGTGPLYIHMNDRVENSQVQGLGLTVGTAIGMVVCSKEFDSFLHGEVGGCKEIVSNIKEGIIKDLLDHNPLRRVGDETMEIPTRYEDSLKAFFLATHDDTPKRLEGWLGSTDHQRLPPSTVDWSPAVMEIHEWTWHQI